LAPVKCGGVANLVFVTPSENGTPKTVAAAATTLQNRTPSHHTVKMLQDAAADYTNMSNALPTHEVVLYFGHGKHTELGRGARMVIDAKNVGNVGSILVAIACEAGANLGKTFDGDPSRAFLGFNTFFGIPALAPTRCVEAIENGLTGLVSRGATVAQASQDLAQELIDAGTDYLNKRAIYGLSDSDALAAFYMVRSNSLAVVKWGDSSRSV
jgi:hypothetical protein